MKYRDLITILDEDGWQLIRTRGSHIGSTVILGKKGSSLCPYTLLYTTFRKDCSLP